MRLAVEHEHAGDAAAQRCEGEDQCADPAQEAFLGRWRGVALVDVAGPGAGCSRHATCGGEPQGVDRHDQFGWIVFRVPVAQDEQDRLAQNHDQTAGGDDR